MHNYLICLSLFANKSLDLIQYTSELERENFTTDKELIEISIRESRIVITKDQRFLHFFYKIKNPTN